MKPISLKLRGFLTYKNEIEIDFKRLYEKKIFVISGDTGSGKTSIFDAIQYALYGGVSRDIDPSRLRSDFLDSTDLYTYVNLVFDVDGKIYEIERIPAQLAKKTKAGQSLTNTAIIYDITGDRQILAEKKGEVDRLVNEIIGFDQNQFSKVMLLAQGEFQQFLQAKSDDRTKLLGNIFKTYEYKDIQEKIKEHSQDASRAMVEIDDRLENAVYRYDDLAAVIDRDYVMVHDFAKILEAIASYQAKISTDLGVVTEKENQLKIKEKALISKLEAAKNINTNIKKANEIKDELAKKLKDKKGYDDLKFKVNKASFADSLLIYENQYKDNLDKLSVSEAKLKEFLDSKDKLEEDLNTAEKEYKTLDDLQKKLNDLSISHSNNKKLLKELGEFKKTEDDYRSFEKSMVDASNLKTDKENLDLEIKKINQLANDKKDEINDKISHGLELRELILGLESDIKNVDDRLKISLQNTKSKNQIEENNREIKKFIAKKDKLEKEISSYYLNQRLSEINKLIDELNDTGKCPVCGEIHDKKFDKYDIKKIDIDNLTDQLIGLKSAIKAKNKQNSYLEESIVGVEGEEILEDKRAILKSSLADNKDEFEKSQASIDELNTCLEGYDKEINKLTSKTNDIKASLAKIEEDASKLEEAKLKYLAAKKRLGDIDADIVRANLAEENEAIANLEIDIKSITSTYNALVNKNTEISSKISNSKENIKTYKLAADKSEQDLEEKIASHFDGYKDYTHYRDLYPSLIERVDEIDSYYKEIDRLETLRENYRDYEDVAYQNLDEINDQLDLLAAKLIDLGKQNSDLTIKLTNINSSYEEISSIDQAYKQVKTDAEVLSKLAKIADGSFAKVAGREKIDFETFVLTYYFDKVLAYANNRLYAMTNGQYKMVRNSTGADKRKKQGLDIEIFDVNTGKTRPSSTLSGGESFLASLSLALGLSDEIAAENGGISIDTLFIDEGFGTLSEEYLNNVIEQIEKLSYENKFIGLISHVEELKEAIDAKILVTYTAEEGSFIKVDQ